MKKIITMVLILSLLVTSLTGCYVIDTIFVGVSIFDAISSAIENYKAEKMYATYGQAGTYNDALTYRFTDEDKMRGEQLYSKLSEMISVPTSDYSEFDAAYIEYEEYIEYIASQYSIANLLYVKDTFDEKASENLNSVAEYYNTVVSKYNSIIVDIYESSYSEHFIAKFYRELSDAEIADMIRISKGMANPEYVSFSNRNLEIESEMAELWLIAENDDYLILYEEYVSNNNSMARLLGYDNYMEFAYKEIYARDYNYNDITVVENFVKRNISDYYSVMSEKFDNLYLNAGFKFSGEFTDLMNDSLFAKTELRDMYAEYCADAAISGVSFAEAFDGLMSDGNLFFGDYTGAFTDSVKYNGEHIPFIYLGNEYNNSTTVAHEFGHFVNELRNGDKYKQSYDILEMHSQGNELLYLSFLEDKLPPEVYELYEAYVLCSILECVVTPLAVNCFERAVYTGEYTGTHSGIIMEDGVIDHTEYEKLYKGILIDLGIFEDQFVGGNVDYWKYVVATSPCYYISYSLSALTALELYYVADTNGLSAAFEKYDKLFTYNDVNTEMPTVQVLDYAGLSSFFTEDLYKDLKGYFKNKATSYTD